MKHHCQLLAIAKMLMSMLVVASIALFTGSVLPLEKCADVIYANNSAKFLSTRPCAGVRGMVKATTCA